MRVFSELRERRIVQILLSYAAVGWIALEVVSQLVEQGVLPNLVYLLALVWVVGGGFATAVLGWYHGEKGEQSATKIEVALLAVVALGTVAATVNTVQSVREEQAVAAAIDAASGLDPRRLAVLYFEDLSDEGDLTFLANGLTEGLIDELRGVAGLDVISRNGTGQYRSSGLDGDSIARILDAGTFVRGEIERRGEDVRVDVALHDTESGATIDRGSFAAPLSEATTLQGELSEEISRLLRTWLGEEVRLRERRLAEANDAAWLLVQRGERARSQAQTALEHDDPETAERSFDRADSLFAAAAEQAPEWAEPRVRRARLIYDRSRLQSDALEADEMMEQANGLVAEALELEPRNPDALEIRGIIRYVRYLLALVPENETPEDLLTSAEEDLRTATEIDPLQANAWNVLGHLYNQLDDIVEANLAARRAYEADAYLTAAPEILWRLWSTSYDLENRTQARQWCEEGKERFPQNPRFYQCELWNMSSGTTDPEIDRAWELADTIVALTPGPARELEEAQSQVLVAAALARASTERDDLSAEERAQLADSARSILGRTDASPEADPARDLLMVKAFARTLLDDNEEAVELLERFLTVNPQRRQGFAEHNHWWWRDLRDDPAFQRMIGG